MRLIIQRNRATNELNVHFTESTAPVKDFLVEYPQSEVIVEDVALLASDRALELLRDVELRTVLGSSIVIALPVSQEALDNLQAKLQQVVAPAHGGTAQ